jgi:hypothetical protein
MSVMELNKLFQTGMVSAATSRARKLPPRRRVKEKRSRGCPGVRCFLLIARASPRNADAAKITIRVIAWVTMASRVRRGDLWNTAEPPQRMSCGESSYVFNPTGAATRFGSILLPHVGFAIMHFP